MLVTEIPLEDLIQTAGRTLRSISWHSDGRVMAKSGAGARHPRKIYSANTPHEALSKLIEENGEPVVNFETPEERKKRLSDHRTTTLT